MTAFSESVVVQAALASLESIGWAVRNGAAIAPGEPGAERDDYGQVVLAQRLCDALARPGLPAGQAGGTELIQRNRASTPEAQEDWK